VQSITNKTKAGVMVQLLDEKTIAFIDKLLEQGKCVEVHREKGNIVVVETKRNLICKTPINS
jgi:hypothetical protein